MGELEEVLEMAASAKARVEQCQELMFTTRESMKFGHELARISRDLLAFSHSTINRAAMPRWMRADFFEGANR